MDGWSFLIFDPSINEGRKKDNMLRVASFIPFPFPTVVWVCDERELSSSQSTTTWKKVIRNERFKLRKTQGTITLRDKR